MPEGTQHWTPIEVGALMEKANKAPGSTIDFMVAHVDLGLDYNLSCQKLYIHRSFGLSLDEKMADHTCVGIALPTRISLGHLFATLVACWTPAIILYHMRNGGIDEGGSVEWKEVYHRVGHKFTDALERFDSRGLQGAIAEAIGKAGGIVAHFKDGDGEAFADVLTFYVTRGMQK